MKLSSASLPRLSGLNRRSALTFAGYGAFFLFFFFLFSYWSFPYGRVRDFLVAKTNQETGYQLSIGELSPHWFTGVHLSEVKLTKPAPDADSEPANLELEAATVRASFFSLLVGNLVISFWGSAGDGSFEGTYALSGDTYELEAELDALDLGLVGVGDWLGLPLRGQANGELHVSMPEIGVNPVLETSLTATGVSLGDGKAKLKIPGMRDGITVERIDAGTLTLEMTSENGVAMLKQFSAQGPDLKLKGDGTLHLARPLLRSRSNFTLGVTFTDKYKQRSDRTKALFQLLDFQPELKRATTGDGTMSFQLTGPLQSIRGVPAGSGVGAAPKKTRGARRKRGT